ncbi:MAG: 16S rRNA (cytosine(1402)-N(4))-methyltransferase RsmH [bacterium]|nr:16S rRNA (cytosine(1402)-N(4))-methyltransferase RsmH [bacterium]
MRTRFVISSGNSMSSNDGHRADEIGIGTCRRENIGHTTVLLHEAIEQLGIQSGDTVVDATLGGAGHATAIAKLLGKKGVLIGMDLDKEAIERARIALKSFSKPMGLASAGRATKSADSGRATKSADSGRATKSADSGRATKSADSPVDGPKIHLVEANFRNLLSELAHLGVAHIDKALFDLGWSGYQLAAGRGFSFLKDEPLMMTYSASPGPNAFTASTIVNEWGEESIADVIFGWGEERYARRIAKKIVERRASAPFKTSRELAEAIKECVPPQYRYGRIHPATRTFQALRIAVNDELGALKEGIAGAWRNLAKDGRIAVITFHSIEDREVKRLLVKWEQSGEGKRITHSPIRASAEEIKSNPRARSAKLRVIEKTISI